MTQPVPATGRCDLCQGPRHAGGVDHPLPVDHPDYDAFYDASDEDLAEMASEAIRRMHGVSDADS